MDALQDQYWLHIKEFEVQFLNNARNMERDCVMAAKQINLLHFRELCLETHRLPDALFVFTSSQFALSEQIVPFFAAYPSGESSVDLAAVITTAYPNVPWIVQYFIHSTFPAMFCNFISAEYLAVGFRFLETHIRDRLIPQLVGVYLLHAFLFRDRLLECFFRLAILRPENLPESQLFELFVEAVENCVQYLSEYHVRILKILASKSEKAAIGAVSYFI
jgi:hypothetical protein